MTAAPRLAAAWPSYNGVLLEEPVLDPRLRELLILRVAWLTRAEYEWVQHAAIGRRAGLTDAHLAAVASRAPVGPLTELERLLPAAADDLVLRRRICDPTWDGLAALLDAPALLETLFVVGSYLCLAMVFENVGLELDPDMDPGTAPRLPGTEE